MKVRKKPVECEALQYIGNELEAIEWSKAVYSNTNTPLQHVLGKGLVIHTLEGDMNVEVGSWIVCGIEKELYPVRNDIFEKTYEIVKKESTPQEKAEAAYQQILSMQEANKKLHEVGLITSTSPSSQHSGKKTYNLTLKEFLEMYKTPYDNT